MANDDQRRAGASVLDAADLPALVTGLQAAGYVVVGPTPRDGAIAYDEVVSADELPHGWTEVQDAGHYELKRTDDESVFGFGSVANSWKSVLFPSRQLLWRGERAADGSWEVSDETGEPPRYALLGVRSCDLHAIAIHDTVLAGRAMVDADYAARRAAAFIIAVSCGQPGGTCFCVSMGTGPHPHGGYDVLLTELTDEPHRFLVEPGSDEGAAFLATLPLRDATDDDVAAAEEVTRSAAARMGRHLDVDGLPGALFANAESARWDDVASRCLSCGNCTMVCPTCFCTSIDDAGDLTANRVERLRVWDSCYTVGFSALHGGSVRTSPRSRYRQWLTHKLASWHDQFGVSGCVGCGRCITWCPAAIDITEEARAVAESPASLSEIGRSDA